MGSLPFISDTGSQGFRPTMIPGAREPGMLTTFGVPPLIFSDAPIAMDAVTTAARQREGGGAPNQRRAAHDGGMLKHLWRWLQGSFGATHTR
jgi:hypothetical protein